MSARLKSVSLLVVGLILYASISLVIQGFIDNPFGELVSVWGTVFALAGMTLYGAGMGITASTYDPERSKLRWFARNRNAYILLIEMLFPVLLFFPGLRYSFETVFGLATGLEFTLNNRFPFKSKSVLFDHLDGYIDRASDPLMGFYEVKVHLENISKQGFQWMTLEEYCQYLAKRSDVVGKTARQWLDTLRESDEEWLGYMGM